jgi:putative CocE/NonD family hydrolase
MQNTLADITRKVAGRVPLWEDIISHPDYDAWWQARDARRALKLITSAMLLVGGTFDAEDPYGVWEAYRTLKEYNPELDCRLVVGPWTHGAWRGNGDANRLGDVEFSEESLSQFYRDEVEFPFFEQYLRDQGQGGASATGALVFFTGENCWREMDEWNTENYKKQSIYLTEDGALQSEVSELKNSYSSYISDPSAPVPYYPDIASRRKSDYLIRSQEFVEDREDVLTFLSPVLSEDMIVAGGITAELFASISTTDADFVVKLIDVGPNGESEMMVRANIMRGRYRNSFSEPEAFTPGKVERIEVNLTDVAHTFLAGHRIKVQVQSSWFPLFDRNPQQFIDIYKAGKEDFIPSQIKIFHDAEHPSAIRFRTM